MHYNFAGRHMRRDDEEPRWTLYDRPGGIAIMRGDRDVCHERALDMIPAWERAAWENGCIAATQDRKALDFGKIAKAAGVKNWYSLDVDIQIRARKMFNRAMDYTQHRGDTPQVFAGSTKLGMELNRAT